jgi:transcriptional regulator with XRE-family HTH domain
MTSMKGGELIRSARKRAGISQTELATRLGTKQPVIARWESLTRSPSFENVDRAVKACGLDVHHSIEERDLQEESLLAQWLQMTPKERLKHNRRMLLTERWASRAKRASRGGV